jgi:hypothetical protein
MGRSLTIGDPAAERVWPVVHMQAGLDPLPYLKTLARDDEVAFPFDRSNRKRQSGSQVADLESRR